MSQRVWYMYSCGRARQYRRYHNPRDTGAHGQICRAAPVAGRSPMDQLRDVSRMGPVILLDALWAAGYRCASGGRLASRLPDIRNEHLRPRHVTPVVLTEVLQGFPLL